MIYNLFLLSLFFNLSGALVIYWLLRRNRQLHSNWQLVSAFNRKLPINAKIITESKTKNKCPNCQKQLVVRSRLQVVKDKKDNEVMKPLIGVLRCTNCSFRSVVL